MRDIDFALERSSGLFVSLADVTLLPFYKVCLLKMKFDSRDFLVAQSKEKHCVEVFICRYKDSACVRSDGAVF